VVIAHLVAVEVREQLSVARVGSVKGSLSGSWRMSVRVTDALLPCKGLVGSAPHARNLADVALW